MRNVVLSFLISIVLSTGIYLVALAIGLPSDVAKGLVSLPALAIKTIYEFLEIQSAKAALQLSQPSKLVDISDAQLNPLIVLLVATIMYIGMSSAFSAVAGMGVSAAQNSAQIKLTSDKLRAYLIIDAALPLRMIVSFYVGRWIGSRCARYGFVVGVAATAAGTLIYLCISMLFISKEIMKDVFGDADMLSILKLSLVSILPDATLYAIIVIIGVWAGKKRRLLRYISLMLKLLPESVQSTVGEIVRDEVNRTKGASLSKQ